MLQEKKSINVTLLNYIWFTPRETEGLEYSTDFGRKILRMKILLCLDSSFSGQNWARIIVQLICTLDYGATLSAPMSGWFCQMFSSLCICMPVVRVWQFTRMNSFVKAHYQHFLIRIQDVGCYPPNVYGLILVQLPKNC